MHVRDPLGHRAPHASPTWCGCRSGRAGRSSSRRGRSASGGSDFLSALLAALRSARRGFGFLVLVSHQACVLSCTSAFISDR